MPKKVIIRYNSAVNHGGGIATNGILMLGENSNNNSINTILLTGTKEFLGDKLANEQFKFDLYSANDWDTTNNKPIDKAETIAYEKNSSLNEEEPFNTISLKIPVSNVNNESQKFYLVEKNDGTTNIAFDETVYKITVKVANDGSVSQNVGGKTWTITKYKGTIDTVEKVTLDKDGNLSFTSVSDNKPTFTNIKLVDLTVKKTVAFNEDKSNAPSNNEKFKIKVTFGDGSVNAAADKDGKYNYVENGSYEFSLADTESATIKDIPVGKFVVDKDGKEVFEYTSYTVTEEDTSPYKGYSLQGIAVQSEGDVAKTDPIVNSLNNTFISDNVKVVPDNVTVTVTNHYFDSKTIDYTVEKKWSHDGIDKNDLILPSSIIVQLCQNGKDYGKSVKITPDDEGNWIHTFKDLPVYDEQSVAYKYSVKEIAVNYSNDTENLIKTYLENQGIDYNDYTILSDDNIIQVIGLANIADTDYKAIGLWKSNSESVDFMDNKATLTNTWTPVYGKLQISKEVIGIDKEEWDALTENFAFKFNITGPSSLDGEKFIFIEKKDFEVIEENGQTKIKAVKKLEDDLIPGKYIVTEDDKSAVIKDHALSSKSASVTVKPLFTADGKVDIANIINNYAKNTLTIKKVLDGTGLDKLGVNEFTFDIYDADAYERYEAGTGEKPKPVTGEEGVKVTADGTRATVVGLNAGRYKVVERYTAEEASNNGYKWSVEYSSVNSENLEGTDGIVTITHGGNADMTVTNHFDMTSLIINKVVNGGPDNAQDRDYDVIVKGPSYTEGQIFKVNTKEGLTLDKLKPGEYTVEEVDSNIDGYAWSHSIVYTNGDVNGKNGTILIGDGDKAVMTITNTYDPTSLTIKKDVTGGPASASTDKEYVFTVTNENGYNETVTIKGTGETTLEGLLPGTYTITEQDARIGGYRWSTTVSVNGGNAVEGVSVPVVLGNPGDDAVVVVNNNYRRIPSDDPPSDPTPSNPTTPTTPTTPEEPTTPVVDVPDPDTPLVDVPEPDVPLTNLPEEPDTPLSELPEPDVPLAEIPDEETPLVELPEDIPLAAMPPEEVPLADIIDGDVPKTGDMGLTMLWIMLCLLALSGITALSVPYLRRRRK